MTEKPENTVKMQAAKKAGFRLDILAILLFLFSGRMWGQPTFLPDSVLLWSPQFFQDQEAAKLLAEVEEGKYSGPADLTARLEKAAALAQKSKDYHALGFASVNLANVYLSQGHYAEAFRRVNLAASLDSLMEPFSPVRQITLSRIGGFYGNFDAYKLALPFLRTALEIDLQRHPKPTPRRFRFCSSLAICLGKSGLNDSADFYYQKAIRTGVELNDPYWEASGLNNYGMFLMQLGRLEEAQEMFRLSWEKFSASPRRDFNFSIGIRDNLGQVLAAQKEYEAAAETFLQLLEEARERKDEERIVTEGTRAAEALIKINKNEQARKLVTEIAEARTRLRPHRQRETYYPLLTAQINLEQANGNYPAAMKLQQQAIRHLDSLSTKNSLAKLEAFEGVLIEKTNAFRDQLEILQLQETASRARARFITLLLVAAVLGGGLLVVVLMLIARRRVDRERTNAVNESYRRRLAELGLKNELLEKDKITRELELKKRDLTDYALAWSQRRKIVEEVLDNLRKIKKSASPDKDLQELIFALRGQLDGEAKAHLGAEEMDKVNHEFFENLKARFAGLSQTDLDLCGLLRLKFSTKDIASLRNIEPASVRISKFRLKKKLGLAPEEDLSEFLQRL